MAPSACLSAARGAAPHPQQLLAQVELQVVGRAGAAQVLRVHLRAKRARRLQRQAQAAHMHAGREPRRQRRRREPLRCFGVQVPLRALADV